MNEYADDFAHSVLAAQNELIEKYKRNNPEWRQQELDAYVFGLIEMGSTAIRLQRNTLNSQTNTGSETYACSSMGR